MKKKTMALMMAAASFFGTGGCSAAETPAAQKVRLEPGKVLIAFYSWSGNTRFAAERIQKLTGGTLFEIKPFKPYPADYGACVDQAKKECREKFTPDLAAAPADFGKYNVVFVGTPNWWSTMAPPVRTFLTRNDFRGKTVIPFVTHGGGGMADCERDMQKACPNAEFRKGGAFSGSSIRSAGSALEQWIGKVAAIRQ